MEHDVNMREWMRDKMKYEYDTKWVWDEDENEMTMRDYISIKNAEWK